MRSDLGDEVADAVEDQADATAARAKQNVIVDNSFWTGNLLNSIYVRDSAMSRTSGIRRFEVLADVPYAALLEFGTGARGDPTAPPKFDFDSPNPVYFDEVLGNIADWVFTKPFFHGPRTLGIAAKITETIIEEGTVPHPYMRPAWFQQKPQMVMAAGLAAKKVVRRG